MKKKKYLEQWRKVTGDGDEAFPRHTQNLAKGDCCRWRQKETDRGVAEPKLPKKWRRKARGGPSEGWISKMAPNGNGIATLESGSCAHTRQRVKLSPLEKIDVWATVCRWGFLRQVDRPHAPRNLRSLVGEELAGKVAGSDGEEIRRRSGGF